MEQPPLSTAFGHSKPAAQSHEGALDEGALEAALALAHRRGQAAWPDLSVTPTAFARFLGQRVLAEREAVIDALDALRMADLYVACAVLAGDPRARAAFSAAFAPAIDSALRRVGAEEDVRQELLERVLFEREGRAPALEGYSGRGSLEAWLRVSATRAGLKTPAVRRHEQSGHDLAALPDELDTGRSPELAALKARFASEFKAAFQHAVGDLPPRDRNLLRYHYLRRLTTRQIGDVYGTHSSTVTRWLSRVRGDLLTATRGRLMDRLDVPASELESIFRLVESQLDVSIERVLASTAEPSGT